MSSYRPETTASKRIRSAATRRGPRTRAAPVVPGLDAAALGAHYGAGDAQNRTQTITGTFKIRVRDDREPLGVYRIRVERAIRTAYELWARHLDRSGFQADRIDLTPGVYPYRDPVLGLDDPTHREWMFVTTGGLTRAPEPVTVHLDPEDLEPVALGATTRGD